MAIDLVSSTTIGSGGAAGVTFSSIPQTGKDLLILISGRSASTTSSSIELNINGTGVTTNWSRQHLTGDGSTATAATGTTAIFANSITTDAQTASTFGNTQIYISNYTASTAKPLSIDAVNENNATAANQRLNAAIWNNTAAITSISVDGNSGNLQQHSTVALYIIS